MTDEIAPDQEVYVALIEADNKIFVMTDPQGVISVANHIDKAREWFESGYRRSGTSSVFHWLSFHPSIVRTTPQEVQDTWISIPFRTVRFHNIAGTMYGVILRDPSLARQLWESGSKPSLVGS